MSRQTHEISGPFLTENGFAVEVADEQRQQVTQYVCNLTDERIREGLRMLGWAPEITKEEAMQKWGLIERPKVVVEPDKHQTGQVLKINGLVIDKWKPLKPAVAVFPSEADVAWDYKKMLPVWVSNLFTALGITEGGGDAVR